jgi:c-di-GMP-binding flagellar brake protein YcgR
MTTNRRKEFRIPYCQQVIVKAILLDNRYIGLPKPLRATTMNLSCSGILLVIPLNLPPRICLCTEIPFNDETISTLCSIVRKEEIAKGLWYYGCKFIQTEETLDKIRRNVFEQQTKFRLNEAKCNLTYSQLLKTLEDA